MKKANIQELNMDLQTYSKVKGKLKPDEKKEVTITGDKPTPTSTTQTTPSSMVSPVSENEVIAPTDSQTIKYLSNVRDSKTGEISKPFSIGGKNYQMVRGSTPDKKVVMAVYCMDEMNESGENIIHPIDHFEKTIASSLRNTDSPQCSTQDETDFNNKDEVVAFLNLIGLEGYKHFFVNKKNGAVNGKFRTTNEMVRSGIKLSEDDEYMDHKGLKRFRFQNSFRGDVSEEDDSTQKGTDVGKLQADVKKLVSLIQNKFSRYLSMLDKPIEQAQFLKAMAEQIGVPLNKLSGIISTYKDIAKQETPPELVVAERKRITKSQLEESLKTI